MCVLYAPSMLQSQHLCVELARHALKQLYSLFCFLRRPANAIMQQSGVTVCRNEVDSFLQEFMPVFESSTRGSWCSMQAMYAPLSPRRGLPWTQVTGDLFRGARCLLQCVLCCASMSTWGQSLAHCA